VKAALYLRVSTDTQESEGTSLESQHQTCLAKAIAEGYQVTENLTFIETYSGLTLDRPELTKLRTIARDDPMAAVIAHSPDRLCRNGEDILTLAKEFKAHGAKLIFVKEKWDDTLNGKLIAFILGWASEFEAAQIKERSIRGKVTRAREGKLPGGNASQLYGYDYINGVRHINEEKTLIVKDIFRWFTEEKLPIGSIVTRLSALKVPSPSGNPYWSKAQICKMLKNRAYTGKTYFLFKLTSEQIELPNVTPPIIIEEVFNTAQVQLRKNKELALRNTKREYLLRGYVLCGLCRRRYTGVTRKNQTKTGVRDSQHYRCSGQFNACSSMRCSNRIWNAKNLEAIVWSQLERVLSSPETVLSGIKVVESEAMQAELLEKEQKQVNDHIIGLNNEQDQLLHWALKGFPEETIVRENERINRTRAELEQHKAELDKQIKASKQIKADINDVKMACELVSKNITDLSFENKRLALDALNVKVWVNEENVRIEGVIPIPDDIREIVTTRSLQRLSLAHPLFP